MPSININTHNPTSGVTTTHTELENGNHTHLSNIEVTDAHSRRITKRILGSLFLLGSTGCVVSNALLSTTPISRMLSGSAIMLSAATGTGLLVDSMR